MGKLLSDLHRDDCDGSSPCKENNKYNFLNSFPVNMLCCYCSTTLISENDEVSRNSFLSRIYILYRKHIFCFDKDCKKIWCQENETTPSTEITWYH